MVRVLRTRIRQPFDWDGMVCTPLDVVFITPSSIRGLGSFLNPVERRLEYHPDVQLRVSLDHS